MGTTIETHVYLQTIDERFEIQDEEHFNKVLEGNKPTLVDFTAPWCGPCRMIAPRVEAAVAATNDEVDLAIIDIDELPDLAEAYNVTAIPCLLGVKDGQIMDRLIGGQDEDTISGLVSKIRG